MMNQEDLLKKTGSILKELQEQFEFLTNNAQKLSELELELFLANANFLTDHIQILRKMANSKMQKVLPEHTHVNSTEIQEPTPIKVYDELFKPDNDTPTFEFIVNENLRQSAPELLEAPEEEGTWISRGQEVQPEGLKDPEASTLFDDGALPVEKFVDEDIFEEQDQTIIADSSPISEIVPETVLQHDSGTMLPDVRENNDDDVFFSEPELEIVPETEEDEIGPEPFLVAKEESPVVPEQSLPVEPFQPFEPLVAPDQPVKAVEPVQEPPHFKHQPTLNELLASQTATPSATHARPALSDLKSAINLNAKLLFVKDLFEGYSLAYSEAIDIVNKMPDFKSADKFLQSNYATKHNWVAKQSTVEQFYELLHQRFPK
jgi:hypothetical protein